VSDITINTHNIPPRDYHGNMPQVIQVNNIDGLKDEHYIEIDGFHCCHCITKKKFDEKKVFRVLKVYSDYAVIIPPVVTHGDYQNVYISDRDNEAVVYVVEKTEFHFFSKECDK